MDEYIKREEALQQCSRFGDYTAWSISDGISSIQAADVAPVVHGRKIEDGDIGCFWLCSLCGECLPYGANYCPNCGAKMDEKAKPEPSVATIYKCSHCGMKSPNGYFCDFCGSRRYKEDACEADTKKTT